MAKEELIELVNRLKKAGIKISFTKPKSHYIFLLEKEENFHPPKLMRSMHPPRLKLYLNFDFFS